MNMKKRGLGILSGVQILLLIFTVFAFSFIISESNLVSADNSISVVPVETAYKPIPERSFFDINDGSGSTIVKYIGTENGVASGVTASGKTITWEAVPNSNIQAADVSSSIPQLARDNWGKTFTLDGKTYATSNAITNPSSVPGLVGQNGQITSAGKTALEGAGVQNPILQGGIIAPAGAPGYSYTVPVIGTEITNFLGGHLVQGLVWSLAVVGAIQLIAPLLGADPDMTNALSIAAGAGIMSGQAAYGLFGSSTATTGQGVLGSFLSPGAATGIGVAVAVIVFVALYKKDSKKVIEFQCNPYEPPLGGADCSKCGGDGLPCSEYRCRSLGQACELLNSGSKEEKCVWVSKDDVRAPTMTPSISALTERHTYTNHETRPPSLGTKIVRDDSTNGCIKPFTPLTFGVVTNEPAQCKIDIGNMKKFDEMKFFLGETNLFLENHTQQMRLPSPDAIAEFGGEELIIGADGIYDFYVKCQDKNGNVNEEDFVFSFCVDPTPDTTPPIIEDTSIRDGSPVAFNSEKIDLSLFVNEPAECRWSVQDKAFLDMENNMSCSTEVYQQNANQLYSCSTQLTGIKDREENSFYFRCKDQPNKPDNERNVNTQSKKFTLLGSQELNIIRFSPEANKTLFDSTESVQLTLEVETSNGANEGQSICYISPSGDTDSYIAMSDTNSFKHSQLLVLPAGTYNYYFRCIDAGGNSDEAFTNFQIETDNKAPFITRLYKEGVDALKIITNEKAECSYSINTCNFEVADGIDMRTLDVEEKVIHFAEWKTGQTYHIKCADEFGNQPAPDACTIQISASTFG